MTDPTASKTLIAKINGNWKPIAFVITALAGGLGWYESYVTESVLEDVAKEARIEAVDGEISTVKHRIDDVEGQVGTLRRVTDRIEAMVESLSEERGLATPPPAETEPIELPEAPAEPEHEPAG